MIETPKIAPLPSRSRIQNQPLLALGAWLLALLPAVAALPPMPEPVTSFGATVANGSVYTYGGNTGKAHEFNRECVKGDFFRLQIPTGTEWEKLPGGLPLLSCALATDGTKVLRIGGMTARNEKGAKNDLHSTDEVLAFDPATDQWSPFPNLPEPRSSHDATVLDHTLYVGGGWNLTGSDDEGTSDKWHETLLTLDLHAPDKGWQTIPQPFQRRALAMAAQGGRIWFIGGIDQHGELLTAVDWYEPATGKWGKGPDLPDEAMGGFGAAACTQGDRLFVSPFSGKLLVLSPDGKKWDELTKLNPVRFFHRLLPLPDGRLLAVGGSNGKGHVAELEILSTEAKAAAAAAPAPTPSEPAQKSTTTADWPQWRGPNRDGISLETGWRKDWPAEGPRKLWTAQVGLGMSSPVIADGRLIATGNNGQDTDTVFAFDAETGHEQWHYSLPCKTASHEMPIVPNGPCATPTIVGDRVFTLTREGDLLCLDTKTGQLVWRKNLVTDFGGKRPVYGYAQSPLIDHGSFYLDIGAEKGATGSTVAGDVKSGALEWRAGQGEAGYSSARVFERDGHRYIAMLKGESLDVFEPTDGHILWSYKITGNDFTNAVTPVFVGHRILVSNTSEAFARLLDWDLGPEPNVRVAWRNQQFALLFNNPILLDGTLYGFNEKRRDPTEFCALDAETGVTKWISGNVPIGTFILADHHWIFLTRQGEVILAPANADALKPIAHFQAVEGKCYATPTLVNGRLYLRSNTGELSAFDLH